MRRGLQNQWMCLNLRESPADMCKVNSSLNSLSRVEGRETSGQTYWAPNTDVYATEEGLVVKAELAGMRREDLELAVEGHRLTICGQRPDTCRTPGSKFLVMEIHYGSFECVIDIPPGFDLSQAYSGMAQFAGMSPPSFLYQQRYFSLCSHPFPNSWRLWSTALPAGGRAQRDASSLQRVGRG